jgi:DNA-binding transcriptional MerR regulator
MPSHPSDPIFEPLAEVAGPTKQIVPKDLSDLLDHLEGYGDDEGRFDATVLWPWLELTVKRRNRNERILRIILKRLLAPKALLDRHWKRLQRDVQEYRQRQKAAGKLIMADAADIVLNAIVDALLPMREVPAKEMTNTMRRTSRAAAELVECLRRLRDTGMSLEKLFPTEDALHDDEGENGKKDYRSEYADAGFYIYMRLPKSLTHQQRADVAKDTLRIVVRDPWVTMGVLNTISEQARIFKAKRHNVSGRQRFAYVMATNMVRDSIRVFGSPRYERAEAFARAACGVKLKGLRQMLEREKRAPATEAAGRTHSPLRGKRTSR